MDTDGLIKIQLLDLEGEIQFDGWMKILPDPNKSEINDDDYQRVKRMAHDSIVDYSKIQKKSKQSANPMSELIRVLTIAQHRGLTLRDLSRTKLKSLSEESLHRLLHSAEQENSIRLVSIRTGGRMRYAYVLSEFS